MPGTTSATAAPTVPAKGLKVHFKAPISRKLVIVGDGGCGKTCLIRTFAHGHDATTFGEYSATVFENELVDVEHNGRPVELQVWDTAGQEEYERLRPLAYPGTDVVLMAFSVAERDTLENVAEVWAPEIRHFCENAAIVLVATKTDLAREVTEAEGRATAAAIGAVGYFEVSALQNVGVTPLFAAAVDAAVSRARPGRRRRWLCF